MKDWKGDGIIARIGSRRLAQYIKRLGVPTVDLLGVHRIEGVPVIMIDPAAVAHQAADHFMQRGPEHFAYCGFSAIYHSEQRYKHFSQYLARAGYETSLYNGPRPARKTDGYFIEVQSLPRSGSMAKWIRSLPKPVGLLACADIRAQQVINVCGESGVVVPDEVAVLGIDNDDVLCELCDPPLSSVAVNASHVGYEAAALLDRMMHGETTTTQEILIPPLGLVTRRSTDVLAISDPDVATAARFIQEHACEGIGLEDVLQCVMLSRSTLKRRFAKELHRSPSAEIRRVQIQIGKTSLIHIPELEFMLGRTTKASRGFPTARRLMALMALRPVLTRWTITSIMVIHVLFQSQQTEITLRVIQWLICNGLKTY